MTLRKRGRRPTFTDEERQYFAELIRQHGARGAREKVGNRVSLNTLLKIAGEFGIELKRGKRTKNDS